MALPELFCGINDPLWCRKALTLSSLAVLDEFPLLFAGLLLELLVLLFELCELSANFSIKKPQIRFNRLMQFMIDIDRDHKKIKNKNQTQKKNKKINRITK